MHKIFWRGFALSSISGLLLYTYLVYGNSGSLPSLPDDLGNFAGVILLANAGGWALWGLGSLLNKILPWQRFLFVRLLAGITLGTLLVNTVVLSIPYLYTLLARGSYEAEMLANGNTEFVIKLSILIFFSVITYTFINFTTYSYHEYAITQVQRAQSTRKQLEMQFDMLKSQLSPHYLFNCLNTISSLIYQDADLAENFIRNFAQTYQYILQTNSKKLVSLQEEIDFVKAYIFLLKVRFDEGLKVDIDLPRDVLKSEIPPLTLQLLVENAVKHNIISEESPLHVQISLDDDKKLAIINNKTAEPEQNESFEIGLKNIKKRYEYFTKNPIMITNGELYKVNLPLINYTPSKGSMLMMF
ncbi:histidine kinase [Flammeovirgaceae bacterium SG7u.111]|nr:histidine kinase [Flammeovirgaceae bacterium SG7u.132]WPO34820.1 histidine kinase [Flammeovirgaceae bacterium SG7u.111]